MDLLAGAGGLAAPPQNVRWFEMAVDNALRVGGIRGVRQFCPIAAISSVRRARPTVRWVSNMPLSTPWR
jgi:hypothetical protein